MEFFTSAIGTLKVLVIALGAGLGVWGVIGGVALIGMQLIPLLANLFSTGG